MSTYSGEPAISQVSLPTAKNIASTTNATPIVVTTSGAHGIQVGSYVRVAGSDATAANGDWIAGAGTTTTTVVLTIIPGGGNAVGTGAGSAQGTILDLGFGVQATLPDDLTDDMTAASVNVPFEEVLDRTAYLLYESKTTAEKIPVNTFRIAYSQYIATGDPAVESITATTGIGTISSVFSVSVPGVSVGDTILVDVAFSASTMNNDDVTATVYASNGSMSVPIPGCAVVYLAGNTPIARTTMVGAWPSTFAGTVTFKIYVTVATGDFWKNWGGGALRVQAIHLGV